MAFTDVCIAYITLLNIYFQNTRAEFVNKDPHS